PSASQACAASRISCGPGEKCDTSRSKKGGHADSGSCWHSERTSRASVAPDTSPRSERSDWHSAIASRALRPRRPAALDGRTKSPMMRLMKEPVAIALYASAGRRSAGFGSEARRLGPAHLRDIVLVLEQHAQRVVHGIRVKGPRVERGQRFRPVD